MNTAISQSDVIGLGMRMVVRMRHEFGCSIDVMNLLHDQSYARSVVDMARGSTSDQLREQAVYLERMLLGPRDRTSPAPLAPQSGPEPAQSGAAAAAPQLADDVAQHRAAVLRKYKAGLR